MERAERERSLRSLLEERILILDGGMGTLLQSLALTAEDFGGEAFEGCIEALNLHRPDAVESLHAAYLEAGADIVETNSLGSMSVVLAEYGLETRAREISREAARIARRTADRLSTPERPRFVAGSMGPTTRTLSLGEDASFEDLAGSYEEQAGGLVEGGADLLLLETCVDTLNIKAGLEGIRRLSATLGCPIPAAVTVTIEASGAMLSGQGIEALWSSLAHAPLLFIGLNCGTGPDLMADPLRSLSSLARTPTACLPNAGLPDSHGRYNLSPEGFLSCLERYMAAGWLNLVGGCCGTTPDHIRLLAERARAHPPRTPARHRRTFLSGIEALEIEERNRPVLVGERTNALGSRAFKTLIAEGRFEEAAEVGRHQVKGGAQVLDVCTADPEGDERSAMERLLLLARNRVRVPFMVDTTDPRVAEAALRLLQGKSVVNSVNLEGGEGRIREIVPMLRRLGAAVVAGCIDDRAGDSMAVTRERKIEVALRLHGLMCGELGLPEEDLLIDPLVFPAASGDPKFSGSARETVEAIRLLKERLPGVRTLAGISNVSFGLPPRGREVLNSVFLYHCTLAGLDLAIVNTERLERYPAIPGEDRRLAEDVLFGAGGAGVEAFADRFRGARPRPFPAAPLPPRERLARHVVEGSREGLFEDLDAALEGAAPLEIINGPLMEGMAEVGRLFSASQLIVAEVLQSAEAMKAAVDHLKPLLEGGVPAARGRILLATVKGDVHDIGKNLAGMILANNGFEVVDLGTRVPPAELIRGIREHRPDLVGLSGLLVRSTHAMAEAAEELRGAGIRLPLILGGAALTASFVEARIAPLYGGPTAYAKDAMAGLGLALGFASRRSEEVGGQRTPSENPSPKGTAPGPAGPVPRTGSGPRVLPDEGLPAPPDFDPLILRGVDLDTVWTHLNLPFLASRHLGFRGSLRQAVERRDPRALTVLKTLGEAKEEARRGAVSVSAVRRFFRAAAEGDTLVLYGHGGFEAARFDLPRRGSGGRCLADLVRPADLPLLDSVCIFVATAGDKVRARCEALRAEGALLRSHALAALAMGTAEAAAEWLHQRIRGEWGIPPGLGRRFSFGYPACPDLAHQRTLFDLLRPEEIGVRLTEGFMMDPEASVSALVFHHPEASPPGGETGENR